MAQHLGKPLQVRDVDQCSVMNGTIYVLCNHTEVRGGYDGEKCNTEAWLEAGAEERSRLH